MARKNFVFNFEEGDGKNKQLLGGKGANLCGMTQIGLPVPPDSSSPPRLASSISMRTKNCPRA